ncbi:MAG: PHP domain-containing protein [Ruminococcaceae bacterium]|nr:PHP domain-containing protein [Oscillospiraceae bacterium]
MYKTEPHMHLKEVSSCSHLMADEMIKLYRKEGYDTVFVTDHFTTRYFNLLGDIPWEDKITIFLSAYYKAVEAGKKEGITVLMGAEFTIESNHYLGYGVTREFLNMYPDLDKKSIKEFSAIAKKHNIFLVQAHPFRDEKYYPTPEYVDAIEVYNSNPRHEDFSEKSFQLAKENGLYMSAGSDTHRKEDVGKSGILSDTKIESSKDFISLIKSGRAKIIKR